MNHCARSKTQELRNTRKLPLLRLHERPGHHSRIVTICYTGEPLVLELGQHSFKIKNLTGIDSGRRRAFVLYRGHLPMRAGRGHADALAVQDGMKERQRKKRRASIGFTGSHIDSEGRARSFAESEHGSEPAFFAALVGSRNHTNSRCCDRPEGQRSSSRTPKPASAATSRATL